MHLVQDQTLHWIFSFSGSVSLTFQLESKQIILPLHMDFNSLEYVTH